MTATTTIPVTFFAPPERVPVEIVYRQAAAFSATPFATELLNSVLNCVFVLNAQRQIVSAGGRVLGVCAQAATLRAAADRAYAVCDQLQYAAKYFRRDIGDRQLNRS